jgi:dTDP-4-dehydrorhamnose 3,5-epimerase
LIQGLQVSELGSRAGSKGLVVELWQGASNPNHLVSRCHSIFPGVIEAWSVHDSASQRVVCLKGMIKLVACDRRADSSTKNEVNELFLGEYRYREVRIPPGVLKGWKAVGGEPALVLSILEGESAESRSLGQEEAAVPYDWEVVMR